MNNIIDALDKCKKTSYSYLSLDELKLSQFPTIDCDNMKQIKYLFINDNVLTSLSIELKMFNHLQVLDVSCNQLTEITYLPPFLIELVCAHNNIMSIINHEHLIRLNCSNNKLSTINNYPHLQDLHCEHNYITHVNTYASLVKLSCFDNPISTINTQPMLTFLDCSRTQLSTKLNNFPNVDVLCCNFTTISDISNFNKLKELEIIKSPIHKLHFIPTLKSLLYDTDNDILISSNYSISQHNIEHSNVLVSFN